MAVSGAAKQYRFKAPVVKPFVEGGLSVRTSFRDFIGVQNSHQLAARDRYSRINVGIVLGAGVDVKVPFVRVSGELRYTRLTLSEFANISDLNQAEVIFGVHF